MKISLQLALYFKTRSCQAYAARKVQLAGSAACGYQLVRPELQIAMCSATAAGMLQNCQAK